MPEVVRNPGEVVKQSPRLPVCGLPWETVGKIPNLEEVVASSCEAAATTSQRLRTLPTSLPKVAQEQRPWALGQNLFEVFRVGLLRAAACQLQ